MATSNEDILLHVKLTVDKLLDGICSQEGKVLTEEGKEKAKAALNELSKLEEKLFERSRTRSAEIGRFTNLLSAVLENYKNPAEFTALFEKIYHDISGAYTAAQSLEKPTDEITNLCIGVAQWWAILGDLKARAEKRREQIEIYRAARRAESELMNLNPPAELQRLRLKWARANPLEKRLLNEKMKTLDNKHTEDIIAKYKEAMDLDAKLKKVSDNYGTTDKGREYRTDQNIGKGQVYPLSERAPNIYVTNRALLNFVEAYFDNQETTNQSKEQTYAEEGGEEKISAGTTPAGCQAIAMTVNRAKKCAREPNPSPRALDSILKLLEKNINDLQEKAESEEVQEILLEAYNLQDQLNALYDELNFEKEKDREMVKNTERIRLPTWSGRHEDYKEWREGHIRLNKNPNEEARRAQLLASIKDKKVLQMVANDATFEEALQTLDQKYGNPKIFIPTILKKLENLKRLPSNKEEESENIQLIKNSMKELRSYDAEDRINENFVTCLADKLRPSTRDQWYRHCHEEGLEGDGEIRREFVKFVERELQINYRIMLREPLNAKNPKEDSKRERASVKRTVAKAGSGQTQSKNRSKKPFCRLCELEHYIYFCPLLQDSNIVETLNEKGICTRCLWQPCKGKSCGKYMKFGVEKSSDCNAGCKSKEGKPLSFKVCGCSKRETGTQVKSNRISSVSKLGGGVCLTEKIEIQQGNKRRTVTILYDGGSDTTLCREDLREFGQKVAERELSVEMADGTSKKLSRVPLINLTLSAKMRKVPVTALGVKNLTKASSFNIKIPKYWQKQYKLAPKLEATEANVDLLLGMDASKFMPREIDRQGNLTLYRSVLTGNHIVGGKADEVDQYNSGKVAAAQVSRIKVSQMNEIYKNFQNYVTVESVDDKVINKNQIEAFKMKQKQEEDDWLTENIKFNEDTGFYTIELLHNSKLDSLEDNKQRVSRIQQRLGTRLQKTPQLLAQVNKCIAENIEKGFWVKADAEKIDNENIKKSFLPFQPELNPNSTSTPVRLVLNSSLQGSNGISLNSTYQNGSCDIGDLKAIMLNTRVRPKLISADIAKYYYNFRLTESEQYLHLLLVPVKPDGEIGYGENYELEPYLQSRLTFGDSPSPTVATLARKKVAQRNAKTPKMKKIFEESSYIDDIFAYVDFGEDVESTIEEMKQVVEPAGMNFKRFYYSHMPTAEDESDVDLFQNGATKALGYIWCVKDDTLKLKTKFELEDAEAGEEKEITADNITQMMTGLTKREALSLTMSIYDPLGLFSPIALNLRLAMQEAFNEGIDWDEQVTMETAGKMKEAIREVMKMKNVSVPRCVIPEERKVGELPHLVGFADAGVAAVGYVIYVRHKIKEGEWAARILTSKAKTGGVRKLSIPRGELLAFQMLIIALRYLMMNLDMKFAKVTALTDSQIVFHQLKKPASGFDTFTGSRIDLIKTIMDEYDIEACHMQGDNNPADLCTKPTTAEKMAGDLWQKTGFLHKPEEEWPVYNSYSLAKVNKVSTKCAEDDRTNLEEVIEKNKFRCLNKVKRILARILLWRHKDKDLQERLELAEELLEIDAVKKTEKHRRKTFGQYKPFKDEVGRLFLLNRGTEEKAPRRMLLLDGESLLGKLVMLSEHDKYHGYSSRFVAAKVREQYYIPQLTQRLTKISRDCYRCKLLHQQEMEQLMAPQKQIRLEIVPAFTHIMIDFAGPMWAYDEIKRRVSRKIYLLIISCLNTRAINTVVARDMTTDTFMLALRQHIAVRGPPKTVYSDLGCNFVGGKRVLAGVGEDEIDVEALENMATNSGFVMKFGTASHHEGQGAVEKMVHLFKLALKRNEKGPNPKMTYMEWVTVAAEMSALVNSRPLLLEPGSGEALTPGEMLTLRPVSRPLGPEVKEEALTKRCALQREFIQRWYEKYFIAMKEKIMGYNNKWRNNNQSLRKDDVVLLLDRPSVHRPYTLARVSQAHPDRDGLVRKVELTYMGQKGHKKKLTRHVNQIALLVQNDQFLFPMDKGNPAAGGNDNGDTTEEEDEDDAQPLGGEDQADQDQKLRVKYADDGATPLIKDVRR